jgi:transposase
VLFAEVRARGYLGSAATLRTYLQPLRAASRPIPAPWRPPKVRTITTWLLRHPDRLDADDRAALADIRTACPHLEGLARHVERFAEILTGRRGHRLDAWIAAVDADDQPNLDSFAAGLRRDHDAVRNGTHSAPHSGAVEGISTASTDIGAAARCVQRQAELNAGK